MKKVSILILFLILCVCGCKKSNDSIVMVTEAGFAPYEYYDNEKVVGVDIDIAQKIAEKLNKKLIIKDVYFDSIINELKSGKADFALAGISVTEERKKQVDFSNTYIKSNQVVIVNVNSDITDISKIYNKKVAVQLGTVADNYVTKNNISSEVVRQKKYLSMVEDLKKEKVDLIIMDELPAKNIVSKNDSLKILDGILFSDSYAVAVKKDNKELLKVINDVIEELILNNEINNYVINHTK